MKIVICDDNQAYLHQLRAGVEAYFAEKEYDDCSIEQFDKAQELIDYLEDNGNTIDILITDIQLDREHDGVSIAKDCLRVYPHIRVIFITGLLEKAASINDSRHIFFLVKPVDSEKIAEGLEKAIDSRTFDYSDALVLSSHGVIERISPEEIVYIDSYGRQLTVHCADGRKTVFYKKMSDIAAQLPDNFCRCHKSYIINMDYAAHLEYDGFYLNKDTAVPVSRHKYSEVKDIYTNYLLRRKE